MIEVEVQPADSGWRASVRVDEGGVSTSHVVTVSAAELARYGGGDAAAVVRRSFEFLLQREPASSILRRFALSDIERYFPEFPSAIRG